MTRKLDPDIIKMTRKLGKMKSGVNFMDKYEVLRRVQDRNSNKLDEMEQDILNRGCKAGLWVGLIACLIAMAAKVIAGVPYYDVYAIYCFMAGGQWIYKWVRLKKRNDLCYGILWCTMAVGLFIGYLISIF
ncbi:DUF6442 family protein [Lachnospiraceae bacterium 48-42]